MGNGFADISKSVGVKAGLDLGSGSIDFGCLSGKPQPSFAFAGLKGSAVRFRQDA